MKRNDSGDFCVLYVEPGDDRPTLFNVITGQKKPVVIMLAEQARLFQRPEDFTALKHVKRQLDTPIVFVIPNGETLAQMASRNGFPVYLSMDALADALMMGQVVRQRTLNKPTSQLGSGIRERAGSPKKTIPLSPLEDEISYRRTVPLVASSPSLPTHKKTAPLVASSPSLPAHRKTAPLVASSPSSPTLRSSPALVAPPPRPRKRRRLSAILIFLFTLAITLAGLGSFLVVAYKLPADAPAVPVNVGHIQFLSSEQLSENSSQGISDQVVIDLNHIANPAPHKSYYAWLLGDKNQSDTRTILLGALAVNNGSAHLLYPGDAAHTNLLLMTSRFLVTEEDASVTPVSPSPDLATWRYYGEFSQTPMNNPDSTTHYSYLDHLRHLLAADPALDEMELPGGLNNWFYRNTGKILEWTGSMREQWEDSKDVGFVRRQTVRALAYLDGSTFVWQDLPPNTAVGVNDRLARVGLLQVAGPNQDPPCYFTHIVSHLNGLLQTGGSTPALRKEEADIIDAMNNVKYWLGQVRHDGQQIMKMTDQQLRQPATLNLINDMIDSANHAYVGQTDPITGQMREGVIWIHEHMQLLATMDITSFTPGTSSVQMIPDTQHLRAMH